MDDVAEARVGAVLHGKYRIERLIGSGGMAAVYEAVHRNGNRVAIKMLHLHLSTDADLRARFLREGYVANRVGHAGVVRVLDDDAADDGSVFLVMELLTGETLDARWRSHDRQLPLREVCEISMQLLSVLAAAHGKGVVHRDIKPENLFVTSEGVIKVLDFGIARLREADSIEGATRTGRMIGTPAFMPPEQALGRSREIDGRTDLWALGATMFTLVSGHFVHEAETMAEMLVRAGSRPARSVLTVAPQLSPPIAAVIDQALLFERESRWPDAQTMAGALQGAYAATYGTDLSTSRELQAAASAGAGEARAAWPRGAETMVAPSGETLVAPGALRTALAPPGVRDVSTTGGTAQGGEGSAVPAPAGRPQSIAGRGRLALLGGFGVAASLAVALFVMRGERKSVESATASTVPPAGPEISASPSSPAPTVETLPPPPAPSFDFAEHDASIAPRRSASPVPPAPRRAPPIPWPTASTPKAPPSPAPPKMNCDPPYFVDSAGHRQYKPECL